MTPSKYSISAASRITGKSRNTIAKHLKQGKLSCEETGQGKLIDASELIRVYGDACQFDREEGTGAASADAKPAKRSEQGEHPELRSLQKQLDKEVAERERERAHYREQIAHLELALERSQEGHNRMTLLLESKGPKADEWRSTVERLEAKLADLQQKQNPPAEPKQPQTNKKPSRRDLPWWRALRA